MPRGYRCIIVAAVGWLSLTATVPGKNSNPPADDSKIAGQIRASHNEVVAAIRGLRKTPEQDRGCKRGQDNHSSDLCAQWKAADAAQDAAEYAFWSLIGTVLGTGLLVWTLWETRSASRRELRAYVSVGPDTLAGTGFTDGSVHYEISILMHNGGSTPAYKAIHGGNLVVFDREGAAKYFSRNHKESPRVGLPSPVTIQIGEKAGGIIHAHERFDSSKIAALRNGSKSLFAFGFVEYQDTFGIKRITRFCYELPPEDFRSGDARSKETIGKPVPMGWLAAPFHNDAT